MSAENDDPPLFFQRFVKHMLIFLCIVQRFFTEMYVCRSLLNVFYGRIDFPLVCQRVLPRQ